MDDMEMDYSLSYSEQIDGVAKNVDVRFSSEGDIAPVLSQLRDFLVACGFNYVTGLVAVTEDGIEHTSN